MTLTSQQARQTLTALRIAIGAGALLAPRLAGRAFGLDPAANPQAVYLGRLFGGRDLMMGYALAVTEGDELDRWLTWGVAVDLTDAAAAVAGGVRGYLPKRAALLAGITALAAATLGVLARGD